MIAFKSCPRCRGDIYMDVEGELSCLQCGPLRPAERDALLPQIFRDVADQNRRALGASASQKA
jgi:hypothetical protein